MFPRFHLTSASDAALKKPFNGGKSGQIYSAFSSHHKVKLKSLSDGSSGVVFTCTYAGNLPASRISKTLTDRISSLMTQRRSYFSPSMLLSKKYY